MFYLKLEKDMSLIITVREGLFRGDNLSHKMVFLIPQSVGEIDMLQASVFLSYVRADGAADIVMLERLEEKYNEVYLQYTFPVRCKMTRFPGEVCMWLQIYAGQPGCPTVAKSGECVVQIQDSKNMDDYLCDHQTTALYQMHKSMTEKIDAISETVDDIAAQKADNLVFHEEDSTIQLLANGEPIGDRIRVSTKDGLIITDMKISMDGELLVFFDDGNVKNLGKVVGEDGAVYVPHLDEHKILSFTLEKHPTEIPAPVDLNPFDEWNGMEHGDSSDYVWEGME